MEARLSRWGVGPRIALAAALAGAVACVTICRWPAASETNKGPKSRFGHAMASPRFDSFAPDRWNACIDLLARPLGELDSVQRPAALVFRYYGRVMNGGHSLHFDYREDSLDNELLEALRLIAPEHATIFAEVLRRHRSMDQLAEEEQHAVAEFIETELDARFDQIEPDLPEKLAEYIDAHAERFPK